MELTSEIRVGHNYHGWRDIDGKHQNHQLLMNGFVNHLSIYTLFLYHEEDPAGGGIYVEEMEGWLSDKNYILHGRPGFFGPGNEYIATPENTHAIFADHYSFMASTLSMKHPFIYTKQTTTNEIYT